MRLVLIFLVLAGLMLAPLLIFGDRWDKSLAGGGGVEWLRGFGAWAWLVGIGLLVSDLLLPIPSTLVMSAMGIVYGPIVGGLVAALGSFAAGSTAYLLTRALGHRAALVLVGARDLHRAEVFFQRGGGWAVALSRPLPLLPEIICCLAGLAGMSPLRFFVALSCGSLPMGYVFAALGDQAHQRPSLALGLSIVLPLLLWFVVHNLLRNGQRTATAVGEEVQEAEIAP